MDILKGRADQRAVRRAQDIAAARRAGASAALHRVADIIDGAVQQHLERVDVAFQGDARAITVFDGGQVVDVSLGRGEERADEIDAGGEEMVKDGEEMSVLMQVQRHVKLPADRGDRAQHGLVPATEERGTDDRQAGIPAIHEERLRPRCAEQATGERAQVVDISPL